MDCCSAERSGAPDHEAELLSKTGPVREGRLPRRLREREPLPHLPVGAPPFGGDIAKNCSQRSPRSAADADLVLEGSWQCPGFAYLLTLRLRKGEDAGAGVVMRGTIEWHLVHVGETPHGMVNPYGRWMATHLGSSGLEHVKGAMLDDRRLLRLAGWRVTDPLRCAEAVRAANGALVYSILGVDQYELRRCADGTRFKGVSRSFHSSPDPSTWSGVFDARAARTGRTARAPGPAPRGVDRGVPHLLRAAPPPHCTPCRPRARRYGRVSSTGACATCSTPHPSASGPIRRELHITPCAASTAQTPPRRVRNTIGAAGAIPILRSAPFGRPLSRQ